MTQLNRGTQHPVQRNEHRNLHQYGQATTERIDFFLLVQRHHLGVELGAIIGVASLNLFQFRGDQLHLAHAAASRRVERVEHCLDQDGEQNNRPAPVAHQAMKPLEQPKHRLGDDVEDAVVNDAIQSGSCGLEYVLLLWAHVQRNGHFRGRAGGNITDRCF